MFGEMPRACGKAISVKGYPHLTNRDAPRVWVPYLTSGKNCHKLVPTARVWVLQPSENLPKVSGPYRARVG